MSGVLFWFFLIAASVGFVWSLLQADPFSDQIDGFIEKIEKGGQQAMSDLSDDAFDDWLYHQEVAHALSKCCEKSKRFQNYDGLYECENCGDISDI